MNTSAINEVKFVIAKKGAKNLALGFSNSQNIVRKDSFLKNIEV